MQTDHRPWPVPPEHWRMKQTCRDLLFAHWPIAAEALAPFIPRSLQLDVYEGQAWIGIVPFDISGMRLRYLPEVPFASAFAEINVRTYVTIDEKPGVYFFCLDAAHFLAAKAARLIYRLPYYYAGIEIGRGDGWIRFRSERKWTAEPFRFEAAYRPVSEPYRSKKGDLDHWLTERYCLYTHHKDRLYRCNILHEPWPLQHAEAEIGSTTIVRLPGVELPDVRPLFHFAERLDMLMWGLEEVGNKTLLYK